MADWPDFTHNDFPAYYASRAMEYRAAAEEARAEAGGEDTTFVQLLDKLADHVAKRAMYLSQVEEPKQGTFKWVG